MDRQPSGPAVADQPALRSAAQPVGILSDLGVVSLPEPDAVDQPPGLLDHRAAGPAGGPDCAGRQPDTGIGDPAPGLLAQRFRRDPGAHGGKFCRPVSGQGRIDQRREHANRIRAADQPGSQVADPGAGCCHGFGASWESGAASYGWPSLFCSEESCWPWPWPSAWDPRTWSAAPGNAGSRKRGRQSSGFIISNRRSCRGIGPASAQRPTTRISKLFGTDVRFLPCLPSLPTAGGPDSAAGRYSLCAF